MSSKFNVPPEFTVRSLQKEGPLKVTVWVLQMTTLLPAVGTPVPTAPPQAVLLQVLGSFQSPDWRE